MSGNSALHRANKAKEDEFYTQLSDIEKELRHYKHHFKDKVVFCNCDDPYESNFFKYFANNFNHLGIKRLIATCYGTSSIKFRQLSVFDINYIEDKNESSPYKVIIDNVEDVNNDGAIGIEDVRQIMQQNENTVTLLEGDGDFRSEECIELLKQADVVVTNPPFSLFREYIGQLVEYDKKFIIIGNQNAITYKEIFPLIAQNKLWLGYHSGDMEFQVPDYYEPRKTRFRIDENGIKWRSMGNICWFTNLDIEKRHENIILYKTYNEEEYPKYDNYDAINVNKVAEIPVDYDGVMGVPITFLNKYNPDQFEIVAFRKGNDGKDLVYSLTNSLDKENDMKDNALASKYNHTSEFSYEEFRNQFSGNERATVNGKLLYARVLSATSIPGMIKNAEGKIGGKITYARVTIRRKGNED